MAFTQEKTYTINDIYALPNGQRAELIDGQIYNMALPTTNLSASTQHIDYGIKLFKYRSVGVRE